MPHTHLALIEIGTEELPPKHLLALSTAFLDNMRLGLTEANLSFSSIEPFATPRRLALRISDLSSHQPDRTQIKRGPAKQAAFDAQGKPTQATLKFAESCGVSVSDLSEQNTPKGTWLIFEQQEPGQPVAKLLPILVQQALDALPIARRMCWSNISESFVRPVHWIVLMLDSTVVPGEFFGIRTGNVTYGHRFHCKEPIVIPEPKQYEHLLLNPGYVIASFDHRRTSIRTQIEDCCAKMHCQAIIENNLLNEVTGLVEWPVVLVGSFDPAFLEIPHEALISAMQVHQKCFAMCKENTSTLVPYFIIVSNLNSTHPESIIKGNESVMRARLADAVFYYQTDKKTTLANRQDALKTVVFQAGLGSLWDKTERLKQLCTLKDAKQAATLCKSDLLTYMVGEFPELQGIMGQYYALQDGESKTVALAIEEHYHPRFANDTLPTTPEGCEVAIADRIDTLTGLFGLGKIPTGDKDPFGLRRQALGLMRIIIEKQLTLDLNILFTESMKSYGLLLKKDPTADLMTFCFERLRSWYQEQGITTREFEAVLVSNSTKPYDFHCRLKAVHEFQTLPEAESLAAANKRVKNILSKHSTDLLSLSNGQSLFNKQKLEAPAEQALADCILSKELELTPLVKQAQYTEALQMLASLKDPVDRFFNEVMVMVDDETLRNNRIALLTQLRHLFLKIADISVL